MVNFMIGLFKFFLKFYICIYIAIHVIFYSFPILTKYLVIQNFINLPLGNLSEPSEFGLEQVFHFHLNTDDDASIGIWHFIPESLNYSNEKHRHHSIHEHLSRFLIDDPNSHVFIYAHGCDKNRASAARVSLCKKIANLGYHVFAFDYRGFGDSTGDTTETGFVNDVLNIYNLITTVKPNANVFLWGHSLGAAVVIHAAQKLSTINIPPKGVILESGFLNLKQASKDVLFAPFVYNNKWIIDTIENNLDRIDMVFESDQHILKTKSKMMILHAKDDWTISHDHGVGLYSLAKYKRPQDFPRAELHVFDEAHGLGHSNIQSYESLDDLVRNFVTQKKEDA